MPFGTMINVLAIIGGSLVGVFLHKHFPQKIKDIVFQAMGIATLVIGIQMALSVKNILTFILSLLIGGIIGEWIGLEKHMNRVSDVIKARYTSNENRFIEGLITSTLLFCIGSMSIVGAINEGLRGDHSLLLAKSVLDGFASILFASTYGIGVLFSSIPVGLYQGSITLFAANARAFFSPMMVSQLTAVGGALIIGLSINLLEIKKIKILNLLPALLVVVILTYIFR